MSAGFHSCNGLSVNADHEKWGTPHLWGDVLKEHQRAPLHAMVGGGDQVYNDAVWKCSALHDWLEVSDLEVRMQFISCSLIRTVASKCCWVLACRPAQVNQCCCLAVYCQACHLS